MKKQLRAIGFSTVLCLGFITHLSSQTNDSNSLKGSDEFAIKKISQESCTCLDEISLNDSSKEKNIAIKECISNASLTFQLTSRMKDIVGDIDIEETAEKPVDTVIVEKNFNINIDENQYYVEVEEYLLRNCDRMKSLLDSDNTESQNSMSDNKKALEFYEMANQYYSREDYPNAIKYYKKALKKDKKFPFAWDNLGLAYRHNGNYDEAIDAYNKSLELDPTGRVPLMNKPIAYLMKEDMRGAKKAYLDFSRIFPNDPEGYYGISRVYAFSGELELALDNILKAFVMYNEVNSPYARDAEKVIQFVYGKLKENDMLDVWDTYIKKYDITIGE